MQSNNILFVFSRVRPIGSTSESDTEFDRMKQVGIILHCFMGFLDFWLILHTRNSSSDLSLQEILDEVVRELHKVKDEIINGKQSGFQTVNCSCMFNL